MLPPNLISLSEEGRAEPGSGGSNWKNIRETPWKKESQKLKIVSFLIIPEKKLSFIQSLSHSLPKPKRALLWDSVGFGSRPSAKRFLWQVYRVIQPQTAQHSQFQKSYSYSKKGNWTSFHSPSCTIVSKQVAETTSVTGQNSRESLESMLEQDFTSNTHDIEPVWYFPLRLLSLKHWSSFLFFLFLFSFLVSPRNEYIHLLLQEITLACGTDTANSSRHGNTLEGLSIMTGRKIHRN